MDTVNERPLPAKPLTLEVLEVDHVTIKELCTSLGLESTAIRRSRFSGGDLAVLLLTLSPLTVTAISRVILEHIRARRYIEVSCNGITLKGLSEHNTLKALEMCLTEGSDVPSGDQMLLRSERAVELPGEDRSGDSEPAGAEAPRRWWEFWR